MNASAAPASTFDPNLRFVRVQCDELDPGPLPVAFQDSTMGPFTHWKVGWLRLTADDGRVGQGPTMLPEGFVDELLKGGQVGEAMTVERWWHKLYWMSRNGGHRSPATTGPIFGVDLAMRDILAQRAGLPLHRFLGAARDVVPVYGSGGGTNLTTDALVAEMADMVASGFTTLKMKVGTDFGTRMAGDVERVRAVRRAIGAKIALAIDGNQTWSADEALHFARQVADLDIAWFEEPVHSADRAALRALCPVCPIPVAMGESENHPLGFRDLVECGVPHLQPSPHALPGFEAWTRAVSFAEAGGRAWSSGGFSHLTAAYLATRPAGVVEYLRSIIGHLATVYETMPRIADGTITLPTTPGLPVSVAWGRLEERKAVRGVVDRKR
ncbi:MAG: mandelate racemase/muconate lactonizing enzyme family protein [Planctomycetota bacterium]|nr:mandelate racemase/muconate lactonizing enzyme family protein [Planctomycetota bacterium]